MYWIQNRNTITHDQGLSWCHGEVIAIKNAKKKTVIVKRAEEHVGEGEKSETVQKLSDNKWNKSQEGAWREYLTYKAHWHT
jgi:hypothetical protein